MFIKGWFVRIIVMYENWITCLLYIKYYKNSFLCLNSNRYISLKIKIKTLINIYYISDQVIKHGLLNYGQKQKKIVCSIEK